MNLLKNFLPYIVVERFKHYRDFERIGYSKIDSFLSILSLTKPLYLESTRLNLLPNNSLNKLNYVVDVGANEGLWSLGVLSLTQPKQLIVIEPSPELHPKLKTRLSPHPTVKLLNLAVGNQKGEIELYITGHSHNVSVLKPREEMNDFYGYGWETRDTVKVAVDSLDHILDELPEVSLLKIDVQGYEKNVLDGAIKTLKKTRFVILEVTFFSHYENDSLFSELHTIMTNAGFYLQNIKIPICKEGRSPWGDAIYINGNLT